MKKPIIVAGALLLAAGMILSVQALAGQTKMRKMTGVVKSVNPPGNTITVIEKSGNKEKPFVFHLAARVKITRDGKDVMLTDLKAGDRVTIEYAAAKKALTAHSIWLASARPRPGEPSLQ